MVKRGSRCPHPAPVNSCRQSARPGRSPRRAGRTPHRLPTRPGEWAPREGRNRPPSATGPASRSGPPASGEPSPLLPLTAVSGTARPTPGEKQSDPPALRPVAATGAGRAPSCLAGAAGGGSASGAAAPARAARQAPSARSASARESSEKLPREPVASENSLRRAFLSDGSRPALLPGAGRLPARPLQGPPPPVQRRAAGAATSAAPNKRPAAPRAPRRRAPARTRSSLGAGAGRGGAPREPGLSVPRSGA